MEDCNQEKKKICSAIVRPIKNITFKTDSHLEYYDGNSIQRMDINDENLVQPYSLDIRTILLNSTIELGEIFSLNFTLAARKNLTVDYFSVKVPSGISIIRASNELTRNQNSLIFKGKIDQGENKNFTIVARTEYAGTETVGFSSRFTIDGFSQQINDEVKVNVTFEQPKIRVSKNDFTKQNDRISIFVTNPTDRKFYDVSLNIKGFIAGNKTEEKIDGLSHTEYTYDFNKQPGKYNLTFVLQYKSEFGQRFLLIQNEPIKINEIGHEETQNITLQKNETPKPEEKKLVELDVEKGIKKTGSIFLILAAALFLTAAIAIIAASFKRKEQPKEPSS